MRKTLHACIALCLLPLPVALFAQTTPPEGLRKNTPAVFAFTNARIISSPGKVVEGGVLVVRDGIVESVGAGSVPADARIIDMRGMTIYPGLIDSYSDYGQPKSDEKEEKAPPERGPTHWNTLIQTRQRAELLFVPDGKAAGKLRAQGFTSAIVVPQKGIFRGTAAVVNLGDGNANEQVVRSGVAQVVTFDRGSGDGYPGSLMGVIALIRQTLLDADWYAKAQGAYARNPALQRPEINEPLAALAQGIAAKLPFIFEATDEQNFLRAQRIAREFSLNLLVRGSGHEYKMLDAIGATKRPVILPLNFPDVPAVQAPEEALQYSLTELRYWDEAPENPKRLHAAHVSMAFTSATLKESDKFLGQIRKAVERGLPADAALAALTTTPAMLFGVEKQLGSLTPGRIANLVITDGDLFAEKTRIYETWIDGKRYEVKPAPSVDPRGRWEVTLAGTPSSETITLQLKGELDGLQGTMTKGNDVKLKNVSLSGTRLQLSFTGDSIGHAGVVRITASVEPGLMIGTGEWATGTAFSWSAVRAADFRPEPDTAKPKPAVIASFPPNYPHGEFGRARVPDQAGSVIVKGATIWTCGPMGNIANGDLLVQQGRIVKVGTNIAIPTGAIVIDGKGKHVTPGLIDAHSHTGVSGSVNEAGQAISAEVRIGDVINANDIDIYRQLAGGLTVAHVLHGSANPIGGQSQLIKLRWGMSPEELKFENAPPTIKFALGENVKQSNWGDNYTTRYPQTRMGVEQIIRDEFIAALEYEKAWQRYEKDKDGIPPRRDLELETILEIIRGKRFIHCHSYRQDEILMLMRLGEELGFKVSVFQHILEGYKVADVMAKHGAAGSSFSDWWAYKLEVYDAIPYNGALMHNVGVLVSFNSDSDEMARRLNTEAAKAVKYGGISETDALNFVTINPARQLKVDDRVGSLEAGKDADFAVWSGHPLSTYSRCEQTWIEGRRFFDLEEDKELRMQVAGQRALLVQKALEAKPKGGGDTPKSETKGGDFFEKQPYGCSGEGHQ